MAIDSLLMTRHRPRKRKRPAKVTMKGWISKFWIT